MVVIYPLGYSTLTPTSPGGSHHIAMSVAVSTMAATQTPQHIFRIPMGVRLAFFEITAPRMLPPAAPATPIRPRVPKT